MPDLTRQAYWLCRSAEYWERQVASKSGGTPHVVLLGAATATRAAASSSTGHVTARATGSAKASAATSSGRSPVRACRCGWHQFTDGGTPVYKDGKPTCPQCGGPVSAEDWAV